MSAQRPVSTQAKTVKTWSKHSLHLGNAEEVEKNMSLLCMFHFQVSLKDILEVDVRNDSCKHGTVAPMATRSA